MIQLGFSVFTLKGVESFTAYSFNAYLFPPDNKENSQDFTLSLNTLDFHKENKFDFNKWVYEGLDSGNTQYVSTSKTKPFLKIMSNETESDNEDYQSRLSESKVLKLFEILRDFKVPIIGHNLLIDLMFIYSTFIGPLPKSFSTFKTEILTIFPLFSFF